MLYAQKLGWLQSVEEDKKKENKTKRYDTFKDGSAGLIMPEVDRVLLDAFGGVGMYTVSMAGVHHITWQTFESYLNVNKIELELWEIEAVMDMSINYCTWLNKGKEIGCECPWHHYEYDEEIAQEEKTARIVAWFKGGGLKPKD